MSRCLVAGVLAVLPWGGAVSASPAGTATASVRTGKSRLTLSGGTCWRSGRGFQVRMIPGERGTFHLSFYTRKAGTHASRPGERLSGGRIAFSRRGETVYSTAFTLTIGTGGRNGTFSGRLASWFGRTAFTGSFTC
jgi:hypothetical protein